MSSNNFLEGLSLKVGPLGENDRLLTLLSDKEGITRLAVPGARRPRSSLAGATPLTLLELQISGRKGLKRVRQLKIKKSFSNVGRRLENLSAAQAIAEVSLLLVGGNDPLPGMLSAVLIHLERLDVLSKQTHPEPLTTLASTVQAFVHLLALGGYGLPVQTCCLSGTSLEPPIGKWDWRCSFLPQEGIAIGSIKGSYLQMNPSELALLQRLFQPNIPKRSNGAIMGPQKVWLKLLNLIECWINNHLPQRVRALEMLREVLIQSFNEQS